MSWTSRYTPGSGVALVGPRVTVLLDVSPDATAVTDLWPLVQQAAPVQDVLGALVALGLSDLPGFGLVARHDDRYLVLCRGRVVVRVGGDPARTLRGEAVVTWLEHSFPSDTRAVTLSIDEPVAAPGFPMQGGVVLASGLELTSAEPPAVRPAQPAPTPRAVLMTPRSDPAVDPDPGREVELDPELHARGDQAPPPRPELEPVPELEPEPVSMPDYDHMFEDTRRPDPVAVVEPVTAGDTLLEHGPEHRDRPRLLEPDAEPQPHLGLGFDMLPVVVSAAPAPTLPPAAAGLIDMVPVAGTAALPVRVEPEEEDDRTINRADQLDLVQRLLHPEPEAEAATAGPVVHAVRCPRGHLNDPQRGRCRQCQEEVPEQAPVTVPRPVLGRLRMSTGDVVLLDRDVLLGRNPKTDVQGPARPHMVQVDNPSSDVSRNHVAVLLDGWHVLVKDLRSKNGTEVQLPERPPQRLRGDDPVAIEPGTQVVLAEGISFIYEVET